jgi:hypothetical protein
MCFLLVNAGKPWRNAMVPQARADRSTEAM